MFQAQPGLGQPLIPAPHTCLLRAQLCVTCWPYRNLTYEDYPETELQSVRSSQQSFMCVTHSFIHLGKGFSSCCPSPPLFSPSLICLCGQQRLLIPRFCHRCASAELPRAPAAVLPPQNPACIPRAHLQIHS